MHGDLDTHDTGAAIFAPDAFALADRGINPGLRILQPGEAFQAQIEMRLDEI